MNIKYLSLIGLLCFLQAPFCLGEEVEHLVGSSESHVNFNLRHSESIDFQPISLDEFTNPSTGNPVSAYDIVLIETKDGLEAKTGDDILDFLNSYESKLNDLGISLRDPDPELVINALSNPDIWGRELRNSVDINLDTLADNFLPKRKDCPMVEGQDLELLGTNPLTGEVFQKGDVIDFGFNLEINASDFIPKLNDQQKILCSLGVSILDDIIPGSSNFVSSVLSKRDELMKKYGISPDHPAFEMVGWAKSVSIVDVKKNVEEVVEAFKKPTPEKFLALADKYKDKIPVDLQLDDVPTIPQVTVNKRTELKLKKAYNWPGFSVGDKSLLNGYADAWAELRAGRVEEPGSAPFSEQSFQAQANAGFHILNKPVNILGAVVDAKLDPNNALASYKMCLLKECIKDQKGLQDFKLEFGNPKLIDKSWVSEYEQQMMVGVVPVVIRFGGALHANAGWGAGLTLLSADGSFTGRVRGAVKGEAAVGVQDLVEAGAGGEVNVVDAKINLTGNAKIQFRDIGDPYLTASLTGDSDISALSGRIYAYAFVDLFGPFGDLINKVVEDIAKLGRKAEDMIKQLGKGSEFANKLAGKMGKSIKKFFGGAAKKLKKAFGFSRAGVLAGTPYGVELDGAKIRYEHDWFSWPGFQKKHRFLNYQVYIGSDGKRVEGNLSDYNPEMSQLIEENIALEERIAEIEGLENTATHQEKAVFTALDGFVGSEASQKTVRFKDDLLNSKTKLSSETVDVLSTLID